MNEYEATIQINPTDDIKFILEESSCYESEIEMMKAGGTYDAFVKRVYDAIDWSHLSERDSNFDWGIFKVKSQKNNVAAKPYIGLDMNEFFRQKMLLIDLSAKVKDLGYDLLADELRGAIGVFDAVQDSAEGDGAFTAPEADEETGLFLDDFYNDVLEKILNADKKKEEK